MKKQGPPPCGMKMVGSRVDIGRTRDERPPFSQNAARASSADTFFSCLGSHVRLKDAAMSIHEIMIRPFPPVTMRDMAPPGRTLLLVIDIQVDFAAPDGAMGRLGLDLAAGAAAIDRIETLIVAARRAGVAVGFARVVTRRETDAPVLRALYERIGHGADAVGICRVDTPGVDYYRLLPEDGDLEIPKTKYSCFVGTGLEDELRARGIDTIVATGMSTDCCVDSTVRDAFHRDFHVFVVADACADYDQRSHAASLASLGRHCAVVVDSETVIAGWDLAA